MDTQQQAGVRLPACFTGERVWDAYRLQYVLVLGRSGYRGTGKHIHAIRAQYLVGIVPEREDEVRSAPRRVDRYGRKVRTIGQEYLDEQEGAAAAGRTPKRVYFSAAALCNGNGQWRGQVTQRDEEAADWARVTCLHCRKQLREWGLLPADEQGSQG